MTTYRTNSKARPLHHGDEHICGYYDREHANTIEVTTAGAAAQVFAHREARRVYGKCGYCHHVRQDLRSQDGRWFSYEAFIGKPAQGGGTAGHNIRLTVTVED